MNGGKNEWTCQELNGFNQLINDFMNELMTWLINYYINEWMNEWMNDRMIEWSNDRMIEWMDKYEIVNERWTNKSNNQSITQSINQLDLWPEWK